jgi:hypothetical protein
MRTLYHEGWAGKKGKRRCNAAERKEIPDFIREFREEFGERPEGESRPPVS